MLAKLTRRAINLSSPYYRSLLLTHNFSYTSLATNYEEKGSALLSSNTYACRTLGIGEKEEILVMCAATDFLGFKNEAGKRQNFVERVTEALGKFPISQQFLQFQTIIASVKFKSLQLQNCDQYKFMVNHVCLQIINKIPSLKKYYIDIEIPDQANFQQTITLLLNLQFILSFKPRSERHEMEQKILKLISTRLQQMNYSVIVSFFADCINNDYDIPYEMLAYIYQKMNLEVMEATYRYYFLKFSEKQYEKGKIYPYHNFFPMFSNIVKFTGAVQADQVPLVVDNVVSEFTLCQKTALKIMPHLFLKKLVGFQKFLNDRKFNAVQLIKIYNEISTVIPLGLRMVKDILVNKNLRIQNSEDTAVIKKFLMMHLKNIAPVYIYSLDENTSTEVNQPLLALMKTLFIRIFPIDPTFILQITPFFAFNQEFGSKFLREFGKALEAHLKTFNPSLRENRKEVFRLVELLFSTRKIVIIPIKVCNQILDEFQKINRMENDVQVWKCLYQLLVIKKESNLNKQDDEYLITMYLKFCRFYIEANSSEPKSFFKEPDFHEEYILRIAGLINKNFFKDKKIHSQEIVKFINKKFVYSAKSVVKQGAIEILLFLNNIPPVRHEIHAYLYSNLSTFVMYLNNKRKFYLQRGGRYENDMLFINTLKNAAKNYELLSEIEKKDRLHILCILAIKYWNNLTKEQILKIMLIIGDFSLMNEKFKEKFKNTQFTPSDIEQISEKFQQKLQVYQMVNPTVSKNSFGSDSILSSSKLLHRKKLSQLSQQEILKLFEHPQYYEKAIELKQFTKQHLIPEPVTSDPKIKMIYVCLKMIAKIRKHRDYSIRSQNRGNQKINIQDEIRYMNEHSLIKQNNLNEFKLNNVEVHGHHEMVEGWNTYEMLEELIELEEYNPFSDIDKNPFKRVLIAVYGSVEMVKQLVKKEIFYSEVLFAALQLGLDAYPKGSMIEISNEKDRSSKELYVLCSNSTNYKIHMIYAFILEQVGYEVRQVEDIHGVEEISAFLSKRFGASRVKMVGKQQEESDSEDMDKRDI